ncbi:hypothetical protein PTKIN_Ptkin12aG0044200 [Pterospermum kingtungense]
MLRQPGLPAVKECEALTLQEAISWVRSLGYTRVIFEVDSKQVVDALSSLSSDLTEFGVIIECCKSMVLVEPHFKVIFARRGANVAAHALARRSRFVPCPAVGFDVPDWLCSQLSVVCNDFHQ